jgi:membrane associated rhomboid family serine protease
VVFFVVFGVLSVLPVVLSKVIALLGGLVGGFLAAPVLHVQLRLREIGE